MIHLMTCWDTSNAGKVRLLPKGMITKLTKSKWEILLVCVSRGVGILFKTGNRSCNKWNIDLKCKCEFNSFIIITLTWYSNYGDIFAFINIHNTTCKQHLKHRCMHIKQDIFLSSKRPSRIMHLLITRKQLVSIVIHVGDTLLWCNGVFCTILISLDLNYLNKNIWCYITVPWN